MQGYVLGCPWCDRTTLQSWVPCITAAHPSLLCLSPYFLLWFNQCWKFSLITVVPRVGCQHLQRGDSHCGACSPCLLSGGCLPGSLPWEANAPMLVTGWGAWVGLFWGAKCLKSGVWWKNLCSVIKPQHKAPALTRVFPAGTERCSCPRKQKATVWDF